MSERAEPQQIAAYLARQIEFSMRAFGEGRRTLGITAHIGKELDEIRQKPDDLSEWVDVIILAMDGYWRHGGSPDTLMCDLQAKQDKNLSRTWPKPTSEDVPVEHDRSADAALPPVREPEPTPPRYTKAQIAEQREECWRFQRFLREKGTKTHILRDATTYAEIAAIIDEYMAAIEVGPFPVPDPALSRVRALEDAMRKVRAHTSYAFATTDLLVGLLKSIERIADAALKVDK